MKKRSVPSMKKLGISVLMVFCLMGGIIGAFPAQVQALDLMAIFDVAGPITRGVMSATDAAKEENWDFGKAFTGTFKAIGKEFLDIEDESPGTTVIVNEVDLSEVEMELSNIQKTLQGQSATLAQIQQDMSNNAKNISGQLVKLGEKIDDKTKQQQYYTYLNGYFGFYDQFCESVAYYDRALSTLYASNPTQKNIKNTFDRFYHLESVSYTGDFYSAIDRLGRYLRGEYVSTDPGSLVDILCQYYELAGYSEAEKAAAVKEFVAQTYYTYCMANYYYFAVALFQDTYIDEGNLADYTTDFGEQINAKQIEDRSKIVLENSRKTAAHVFYDLNKHFSSVEWPIVSYKGPEGIVQRQMQDSTMKVEPNSEITMPTSASIINAYLGDGYDKLFGGMCVYSYTADNSNVTTSGDRISIGNLSDGTKVKVTMNCTIGDVSLPLHVYTFTVEKSSYAAGYGTGDYPYVIKTVDQFKKLSGGGLGADSIILASDLDFKGAALSPITGYSGSFYGNGHTLSNFTIDKSDSNVGLFATLNGGKVYDLTVKNAKFKSSSSLKANVGAFAGLVENHGAIVRCEIVDTDCQASDGNVGGIAGKITGYSSVTGCIVRCVNRDEDTDILATTGYVGGVVGCVDDHSTIDTCGRENGYFGCRTNNDQSYGGGIVGSISGASTMKNCWSYKTNDSSTDVYLTSGKGGVFVGYCRNAKFENLYLYTGEEARPSNVNSVLVSMASGDAPTASNKTDFSCGNLGLNNGYLTNDSSAVGKPIRLRSCELRIINNDVKTDYYYGEDISYVGLWGYLYRGDVSVTKVPFEVSLSATTPGSGVTTVKVRIPSATNSCSYKIKTAAKPHVFEQTLKPSTCTEQGLVSYQCKDKGCTATLGEPEVLPARGHMLTHHDAISAGCDGVGQKEYWQCTTCSKYFLDDAGQTESTLANLAVVGTGHMLTHHDVISAGCNGVGQKEHWQCTTCSKYFLDDAGQTESTLANLAVAGTGHTFGSPQYAWTKGDDGYICTATLSCTNKGCSDHYDTDPITEKGAVTVKTTEPTCTEAGLSVYTATFKNEAFKTQTYNEELGKIACPSAAFSDALKTEWYHGAVDFAISNGLMKGMSATTFEPNTPVNRAMLATMLYRLEGEPAVSSSNPFTDVKNDAAGAWYYNAVLWASQNGIVKGYEDSTFRPVQEITRAEMAVMMHRYAKYKNYDVSATGNLSSYPDVSQVDDWAYEALSWANAEELITGSKTDNGIYILPRDKATRAQVATIFMRYINNIVQ